MQLYLAAVLPAKWLRVAQVLFLGLGGHSLDQAARQNAPVAAVICDGPSNILS